MNEFTLVRSMQRSSVSIQIKPDGSILVKAPYLYPKFLITRLLKEKESWIKEKQQLLLARKTSKKLNQYYYLGKAYELGLKPDQKELVSVTDKMYLASFNEKYKTAYLTSWYKKQARKIIGERVALLARKSGDTYHSIGITSADTRWGSCSSRKTLNFNWKLVMAPLEVIDYVIAHELAHLTELNHSRDFWERVRKIYPLYREYRTWLKRNGHLLTVD